MHTSDGSASRITDRRGFLTASLGVAGAALIGACGTPKHVAKQATTVTRPLPPMPKPLAPAVRQTLTDAVQGRVFTPGTPGYQAAAQVFNERFDDVHPQAVARPRDAIDVRNALRYTVDRDIKVRARSGGHSFAGYSTLDDGVVLDLRDLNQITVDARAGTATIGAGAQLIDIYAALAAAGVMLPGGSCPSVGISGVTLGGGFGVSARNFGLTADNLLAAQIATADGALGPADADLLWGLRGGGGGNFGIVTEFTFRVHPLPSVATAFEVRWPWSSAAEAVDAWQRWAPSAPREFGSILHLVTGDPPTIQASGQFLGSGSAAQAGLRALMSVPGAQLVWLQSMPFLQAQYAWAGCTGMTAAACHTTGAAPGGQKPRQSFNAKSDYVSQPLDSQGLSAIVAAAESHPGSGALLCDAYGGAVNAVAPDATAFVHRDQLFCIQYFGNGPSSAWIDQGWQKMAPYVSGSAYQNYIDPHLSSWREAYYGANQARLSALRRQVDPHHYFDFPQAIV